MNVHPVNPTMRKKPVLHRSDVMMRRLVALSLRLPGTCQDLRGGRRRAALTTHRLTAAE